MNFTGAEPISSEDLGDVIYASLGNGLSGDAKWPCLNILDPFNLPENVVTIRLDGVTNSKLSAIGKKSYQLEGHRVEDSLNAVADQLEADNEPVCVMNFENFEEAVSIQIFYFHLNFYIRYGRGNFAIILLFLF